jgi:hypothetical protein
MQLNDRRRGAGAVMLVRWRYVALSFLKEDRLLSLMFTPALERAAAFRLLPSAFFWNPLAGA